MGPSLWSGAGMEVSCDLHPAGICILIRSASRDPVTLIESGSLVFTT